MTTYDELMAKDEKCFAKAGRIPYYPLLIDHAHCAILVGLSSTFIMYTLIEV